jgi:hypothetical protein
MRRLRRDSRSLTMEMARKAYPSARIHYTRRILIRIYNRDGLSCCKHAYCRWEFGGDTVVDANKYVFRMRLLIVDKSD